MFWLDCRCVDAETMAPTFGIGRGTATRIAEIDAALPQAWIDSLSTYDFEAEARQRDLQAEWWGFFTSTQIRQCMLDLRHASSWSQQIRGFILSQPLLRLPLALGIRSELRAPKEICASWIQRFHLLT